MIVYGVLIPLTIVDGIAMGYFSVKCSHTQGWLPFLVLVLINIMPLYAFVSRYSKNLIFDKLLFNIALMGSYLTTVILLDDTVTFSKLNLLGLLIAFAGFVLLKLKLPQRGELEQKQPI